jgi:hypothetical protein
MKMMAAFGSALVSATLFAACTSDAQGMDARQIEQQYGVAGAYESTITTSDGPLKGTLVPITLANGRQGHLFVPQKQTKSADAVYVRDEQGLHPVELKESVSRDDVASAPAVVEARPERQHAKKRSWEKEALIIGGSAGVGTAIGAIAGGKKGAGIGAAAGGIGGLIYDVMTREKK